MRDEPYEYKNEPFAEEVARATRDFELRTLGHMQGLFNQLVYLSSLRNYNTGRYHHYGLEMRFSSEAVDEALRRCHLRVFEGLVTLPLKHQTEDLVSFFESLKEDRARLVEAWQRLRSYQVLLPADCHPLAKELFNKNLEVMLQVLRETELWPLLHDPHRHTDDLA
jgi:hypothetical protein